MSTRMGEQTCLFVYEPFALTVSALALLRDSVCELSPARWNLSTSSSSLGSSRTLSDLENLSRCKQTSATPLSALCIEHKQHDDRMMTTTKKGQNSKLLSVLPSYKTDGRCRWALETFLICHTLDLARDDNLWLRLLPLGFRHCEF